MISTTESTSTSSVLPPSHSLPSAGCLPEEDYDRLLGPWRSNARKLLVNSLKKELNYLEWIQTFRTPARDIYFVKSSLLGTHTAFMILVPMFFWFGGYGNVGRGLLYTLAAGGYITSVLKDLLCVPRPYAPPLVRLAVGNHALEYGFPSTHSTNSVSMALYFGAIVMKSYPEFTLSTLVIYFLLAFVALTVVFGRLYTGMHSMMDVGVGSLIGVLVWYAWYLLESTIELWTLTPGWIVPTTFIPFTLFLVFYHPSPAEDCPCFEDAVAFVSVFCGILVGRNLYQVEFIEHTLRINSNGRKILDQVLLSGVIGIKLILGVLIIFTWRLVAKEICHLVLPPIFRFFSSYILPNNHYKVNKEYNHYHSETLHAVPSVLDLNNLKELEKNPPDSSTSTGISISNTLLKPLVGGARRFRSGSLNAEPSDLKFRGSIIGTTPSSTFTGKISIVEEKKRKEIEEIEIEKMIRRDVDVLTKVLVYAGIGWNASIGIPILLKFIGLNV